jgi:chromosome segregation ATPase
MRFILLLIGLFSCSYLLAQDTVDNKINRDSVNVIDSLNKIVRNTNEINALLKEKNRLIEDTIQKSIALIRITDSIKHANIKDIKRLEANLKKVKDEFNKSSRQLDKINLEAQSKQDSINSLSQYLNRLKDTTNLLKSEKDNLEKEKNNLQAEKKKLDDQIQNQFKQIALQKDSMEIIADITMNKSATIYELSNKSKISSEAIINQINMRVQEGVIVELIVKTDKGIFRNTETTINLISFAEEGEQFLILDGSKGKNRKAINSTMSH